MDKIVQYYSLDQVHKCKCAELKYPPEGVIYVNTISRFAPIILTVKLIGFSISKCDKYKTLTCLKDTVLCHLLQGLFSSLTGGRLA